MSCPSLYYRNVHHFVVCVLSVLFILVCWRGNASKTSQHMSPTPSNTVLLVWRGSSYVDKNESAERKMSERQDASPKEWDNPGILSRPTGLLPIRHSAVWKPKSLCQSKRVPEPLDKHRHLPVKCLSRRRDCLSPAHCNRLFLLGKCVCLQTHENQIPCVIDSVSAGTEKQQQHWGKLTEKRRCSEIRGINNHVCLWEMLLSWNHLTTVTFSYCPQ